MENTAVLIRHRTIVIAFPDFKAYYKATGNKISVLGRCLQLQVHCSIAHNTQNMKTTCVCQ